MISWQDLLFTAGGIALTLAMLPTAIRKSSKVPLEGSLPIAIVLASFVYTYITLDLWGAALTTLTQAILWSWVALKRRLKSDDHNPQGF